MTLPYGSEDCVRQFLADIDGPPELVCVHLALLPGLRGLRQMCAPERAACLLCSVMGLDRPCVGCHCCGSTEGPLRAVTFGTSQTNVVCGASLCGICLSLVPPGIGTVVPVTGSAGGAGDGQGRRAPAVVLRRPPA